MRVTGRPAKKQKDGLTKDVEVVEVVEMNAARQLWWCGIFLIFSACVATQPPPPTPDFIAWSKVGPPKKRMCVLPFANQTEQAELAERVRRRFAGHLSVKRFSDSELYEIDATLARLGRGWQNLAPQELGKALGCDALAYGAVTDSSRLYLLIYSQLSVAGEIRIIDVTSGQTLVDDAHVSTLHLGGSPLSPLAILYSAISSLQNFGGAQLAKAVDDLGLQLAEKVPDLPTDLSDPTLSRLSAPGDDSLPVPEKRHVEDRYHVQVAAFESAAEAHKAAEQLGEQGYQSIVEPSANLDHIWHRVSVGSYPSAHEAYQVRDAIQAGFAYSPIVTRVAIR